MEAATAGEPRRFDHLREHSIGLPQVLFQSIATSTSRCRTTRFGTRTGSRSAGSRPARSSPRSCRRVLVDAEHFFAGEEETGEPEDEAVTAPEAPTAPEPRPA